MTRLGMLLVLIATADLPLAAQVMRFEVASIKPTRSVATATVIRQNEGGRFVAENITLFELLQQAYDVYDFQIIGVPAWAERDRFDVQAIAAPETSREQQAVFLRQLLEDRFMVRTRREMRERDVYALVIAREDKRLGPNLRPFTGDCTAPSGGQSACRMRNGPNFTDAVGMPFSRLLGQVRENASRFVLDKTGLTGRFDFKYEWTSDLAAANGIGDRVSFITALQEQLGLRLVSDRAQVEVLVIDSVTRPTPD
jgi:uncharacterized protein (TIGR03435 family)